MAEERVEAEREERTGRRVEPGAGHVGRDGRARQRTKAGAQGADGRAIRHERLGSRAADVDFDLDDPRAWRGGGQPGTDDRDEATKRTGPGDQPRRRRTKDVSKRSVRRHADRDQEGEHAAADRQEVHADGDLPHGHLSARDAARAGLIGLSEMIKSEPVGVTAISPRHDGWIVGVEVVELERVPSSASLMALYEAELDMDGTLRSYRRVRRYARGRGEGEDR